MILNPLEDRPGDFEMLGATLENAARLQAAGVLIAIEGQGGDYRAHEARYDAGNAVAHGHALGRRPRGADHQPGADLRRG